MIKKFTKSNWLVVVFLLLIVAVLFLLFSRGETVVTPGQEKQVAHVVRVIDGDTVEILSGKTVRYLGINAPEKGDPWSLEAKELNSRLVEGKDVELVFDQEKYDHYNRLLAYVYLDEQFINEEILKQGLATSYIVPPNDLHQYILEDAELEAKTERKGLWSVLN